MIELTWSFTDRTPDCEIHGCQIENGRCDEKYMKRQNNTLSKD